jgi:hypothetical protein
MSEYVYAGLTSQTVDIFLQDSSSSTGQGLAGLVHNSAGLVASYRKGATGSRTAITLATQTVGGAWSSGGFVEIDATNMKGVYRLDLPNAAVDSEGFVTLFLYGATNLLPTALRIDCRPLPVDVKKFGGTAITAAAGIPEVKVASIAANAVNASSLATDAVTEIQSGLATSAALAAAKTILDKVDTGLVVDGAVYQFTANMLELGPSGGGGGDATLAKQTEILAAIQGSEVIQVASPNVSGNLVLTQGDDYDGVANPRAQWTVTTDYTTGWTVRLTIRDADDAVVYTNTGSVVSSTVVAVTIAAPTGLTMTGCPGQWQGKFDVELTHSSGKKKTIALGVCYINEDQTR